MAIMPGASRVQKFSGNRHKATIDKIVIHTTEGSSWPGYNNGGNAPHFTAKHTGSIRQHIDTAFSAKALVNRSGGVETNNDGVLQVENIGSCDRAYARRHNLFFWPDADDDDLLPLARILAWAHEEHGVPLTARSLVWSDTNAAYATAPQRMTFDQWRRFTGVCGHQHVPENDHWDPGKMPVARAIQLARDLVGATADVPAADPSRPWRTSPRVSGYSETEVRRIQVALRDAGYDLGSYGIDGSYGDATGRAVLAFQTDVGLTADGIYGPSTEAEMSKLDELSKKIDQIPARILDAPVDLEGAWKGQKSTLRRMRAWYAEDLRQIKEGVVTSRAAVLKAVQETGKAQGLTDEQVQEIASAAAEAAARVSAEDVAGQLEVTVTKGD